MKGFGRRELIAPLLLGALILGAWWLLTSLGAVPDYTLPTPRAVLASLRDMLVGGEIWPYLGMTLLEAVGGALLGTAVALPLAVLIHRSRWFSAATQPYLGATQAIPAIALAPLLVLWIGYGLWAIVALCALMVFFPILISTVVGLRHVDPDVVDAARIDGAGSWTLLRHVEAPLALPSVLAGLRNGVTLSVTGAVVGEMVMGGNGIGTILTVQRDAVDTAGMFASILILCVIASTAYSLIHTWEQRSQVIESLTRRPSKGT
ncbi:MAG: ABC transporter permease [Micrococcales bacterium]|nr:ABC transporter permease [Micrococcales bacterium]